MTQLFNRKTEKIKRKLLRKQPTRAEKIFWQKIRKEQLGHKFRRQYSVGVYVLDFYCYCVRLKLGIEIDGDSHYSPDAIEYDKQREAYLMQIGISIIRFTNPDVYNNPDEVLLRLKKYIAVKNPSQLPQ